jgi:hypothetical protein
MANKEIKTNWQRSKNYWEPIFKPEEDNKYEYWQVKEAKFNTTKWKKNIWIDISEFKEIDKKLKYRLNDFTFENVDFEGTIDKKIKFENCTFISCSFRHTEWKNIKFYKCKFNQVSLSMSKFIYCEFRDCDFKKIGISGNETKFIDIYIRPKTFISAAYTNLDEYILKENSTDPLHQKYRLAYTKSKIARMLLRMKPIRADIDVYAEAKKTARMSESIYYIYRNYYNSVTNSFFNKFIPLLKLALSIVELIITYLFGKASGWGLKIGRTAVVGFLFISLFSLYYHLFGIDTNGYFYCFLRSLEYWFFIGYTKYPFKDLIFRDQIIIFFNSFLGMMWFGTLIPVILEKLGKSDE